jgi:DMSO/TMAO reductase YedYZ molybdopterin-dependent catalytic subunit
MVKQLDRSPMVAPLKGGLPMSNKMRIMSERPLNAETPTERLRSWITANDVFFDRNQGQLPDRADSLEDWRLHIHGVVEKPVSFSYEEILRMPKVTVSNTLECSGNSRSLLTKKASGNPWTIGGVGNAIYGGIWLRDLLDLTGVQETAGHVAFEGMDTPLGKSKIKFIRSIPINKALESTLLAYEMNGEPLPLKHGYPLRALALGWTGANCVKWLNRITVLEQPYEGFFMDKVYRVFQKGEDPKTGKITTGIKLKSIITQPLNNETSHTGSITILGAAYAGEDRVVRVDVSVDKGKTWYPATFIGPDEPFAWRQWQFVWEVTVSGEYDIMARAHDSKGHQQPLTAEWNVQGYFNNGIREHAIHVRID